ncbi:MAG TPA: TlpA disulfide reductase family protein [Solirubrobacterales bacterium]|jgi:cytochrome c biogenesis protein CcmG/thiol:disulfide interchange protein DsbE|nr:TlpA disulfide reductase family protein [Solirubrobacterales bacterium]
MERRRSPFAIPVLFAVTALLALLVYGVVQTKGGGKIDEAIAEGKREPAKVRPVRLLDENRSTSLAEYRGKVVLLNFWASWCKPCQEESPAIERAYRRYKDKGFIVLGADVDDLSEDARAFVRKYKLSYPIMRYGSSNATKDFGTRAFPESFVIDRRGRVAALQRFQVDDKWLNENIAPVVAEQQ